MNENEEQLRPPDAVYEGVSVIWPRTMSLVKGYSVKRGLLVVTLRDSV